MNTSASSARARTRFPVSSGTALSSKLWNAGLKMLTCQENCLHPILCNHFFYQVNVVSSNTLLQDHFMTSIQSTRPHQLLTTCLFLVKPEKDRSIQLVARK